MLIQAIREVLGSDDGATMVEYAIMVAFIVAVCFAVVTTLGKTVSNQFSTVDASF